MVAMRFFFDPSFGYVCMTGSALDGAVIYGRGPVVPHDPTSLEYQRYQYVDGWVEVPQHHVPDEWLIAFQGKKKEPTEDERIILDDPATQWTVRDCIQFSPVVMLLILYGIVLWSLHQ